MRRLAAGLLVATMVGCAAPAPRAPAASATPVTTPAPPPLAPARVARLRAYIKASWATLTRTAHDLPRAAADDKAPHAPGAPWPVYLAADEDRGRVDAALAAALTPDDRAKIDLRALPAAPVDPAAIKEHGLLYLPHPYVVPGGRFNEMYGWDSYFIVLGLVADGELGRARDMVDNFVYEVSHYGAVLNANRTYYLSRSQPPLLSEMVLAVFLATGDREWLRGTRAALEATYRHWTSPPHLIQPLGLSRYYDHGEGPAPEVVTGERDAAGQSHYDRVRAYYRTHAVTDYAIGEYYRRATDELTPLFFKGDRSMRESGFDPSDRFGAFGVDVIHYAPVCLNTLLYQMEVDLGEISARLGADAEAAAYEARARRRRALVDQFVWDERAGQYFDYNFETGQRRQYPFATTFWPLWSGLASPAQAKRVRESLYLFERPGGIRTSTKVSGSQWDAPFGWAPLQLFAVEGLRRAGFAADAERLARAWLAMLLDDFDRRATLVEKYDVERRTSQLAGALKFGYGSNEVGFGWTNGVALELLRVARAPAEQ